MVSFRFTGARLAIALAWSAVLPAAIPSFTIETVAGSSFVGDGGPAALAVLSDAEGVCTDRAGNVYVSDTDDHRVRKIAPSGIVSTVAGTGIAGFQGDGGQADQAQLNLPYGISVDPAGNLYIADLGNGRVRRVAPNGVITTVAGNAPDRLLSPRNVLADDLGNLFISEFDANRIRRLAADGALTIFAGTGVPGFDGDGGAPASARLNAPAGMAFDKSGAFYFADSGNQRIRKIVAGSISTVIGAADAGASAANQLSLPTSVAIDGAGNLFIADSGNRRIRKLATGGAVGTVPGFGRDLAFDGSGNLFIASGSRLQELTATGVLVNIAGDGTFGFHGDGGRATVARLSGPSGIAVDASGNFWIGDEGNGRIRAVSTTGVITTAADQLSNPSGLALDRALNLFIAEKSHDRIRKMTSGALSVVAGNGTAGFSGDLAAAVSAQLQAPGAVAVDASGILYIADSGNHRVRRVNANGTISTIAGPPQLDTPRALFLDASGNLFIADAGNHSVRKLSPQGDLTIVAGAGVEGFSGDGGQATGARLSQPRGVAVDGAGNIWIADTGNHRLRVISPNGVIATAAGGSLGGFSGDGGPADVALFRRPSALTVDNAGAIWIADTGNNRIRKMTPSAAPIIEELKQSIAVVNAASLQAGPVAPGSIVSLFGSGMGPANGVRGMFASPGVLATTVAGSQVLFDGRPAPLFFVQDSQINAQVPPETVGHRMAEVEVLYQGVSRGKTTVPLADSAPAIFTLAGGSGQAVVLNQDGSLNSDANAATRGSIVTFFATGGGQSGLVASVIVAGYAAELLYAGDAPGFIGLMQINARVPGGFAPLGTQPLSLQVGAGRSPIGVTIAIK